MHISCYKLVLCWILKKPPKNLIFTHTFCRHNIYRIPLLIVILVSFICVSFGAFLSDDKKVEVYINQCDWTKIEFEKFFLTSAFFLRSKIKKYITYSFDKLSNKKNLLVCILHNVELRTKNLCKRWTPCRRILDKI